MDFGKFMQTNFRIYIFDIDGTLSIVGNRLKYLQQDKPDWDAFYNACSEDAVNEPIAAICRQLAENYTIIYVTGRRESCRMDTYKWLEDNKLPISYVNNQYHLLMRPDNNVQHDTIVKPELIKDIDKSRIEAIFEDRASMVAKWRELGYTCLQVAEGNF